MEKAGISKAFMTFMQEAPQHSKAWAEMIQKLSEANALDPKTSALVYLGILAVAGLESGIPFHVKIARESGASREEIISAILLGLPAVGNQVIKSLVPALETFDSL